MLCLYIYVYPFTFSRERAYGFAHSHCGKVFMGFAEVIFARRRDRNCLKLLSCQWKANNRQQDTNTREKNTSNIKEKFILRLYILKNIRTWIKIWRGRFIRLLFTYFVVIVKTKRGIKGNRSFCQGSTLKNANSSCFEYW